MSIKLYYTKLRGERLLVFFCQTILYEYKLFVLHFMLKFEYSYLRSITAEVTNWDFWKTPSVNCIYIYYMMSNKILFITNCGSLVIINNRMQSLQQ